MSAPYFAQIHCLDGTVTWINVLQIDALQEVEDEGGKPATQILCGDHREFWVRETAEEMMDLIRASMDAP